MINGILCTQLCTWLVNCIKLLQMCLQEHITSNYDANYKVIHPKYYKHLIKGAHQSHLGREKIG